MKKEILRRTASRMFSVGSAFIIFGIIDNGVMVVSGSLIEDVLGRALGISSMASAGLGNTLSDIVGIICGRFIEKKLFKNFNKEANSISPRLVIISEVIGITAGCLIGMLPLLFFKNS